MSLVIEDGTAIVVFSTFQCRHSKAIIPDFDEKGMNTAGACGGMWYT